MAARQHGRLGFCFPKLRRTGERNLKLAFPQSSADDRRRLLLGSFQNLGRLLALFSHFSSDNQEALRDRIDCDGLEHLEAAQKSGRGAILFTGHIGAWELTSFGLALSGFPLSFLVRRIDNPKIEALIDRARERVGNRTIDKRSAARETDRGARTTLVLVIAGFIAMTLAVGLGVGAYFVLKAALGW